MNITLRPSGGRGEYELAGQQGDLHPQDLFGLPMYLEILPGVAINAQSHCILESGKPRIRKLEECRNAHPSPLIAAAMMLPRPRRERGQTGGSPLLRWNRYVVQTIRIDVVIRPGSVLIRPVSLRLENATGLRLVMSFADRMTRVVRVWTAAAAAPGSIAEAVRAHATAFTSPASTQQTLVASYSSLHNALGRPADDMLPIVETHFGISMPEAPDFEALTDQSADADFIEEVHIDPLEARIERVRQWRLCAVRGSNATAFRQNVRESYDWRCLFSGQRLPRTDATLTAGVDAAHILPWSRFDIDATANGLCLSKQCHWAFDAGLFRLNFDAAENVYVVSIPEPVTLAAHAANFDLGTFQGFTGIIPQDRLPSDHARWPSPNYLTQLNQFIEGEAA